MPKNERAPMKFLEKMIIACMLLTAFAPQPLLAETLVDRTSGYILLQVQEHGEAWYINPADKLRYYMKDGAVAYEMMRSFGLGITNADLNNIPQVNSVEEMKSAPSVCGINKFAQNVKGKILLQVQEHGEAWYVYPEKCYRIYMKDGDAAYQIMRYLGLGITNTDLQQLDFGAIKIAEQTIPQETTEQPVVEKIVEKIVEVPTPVVTEQQVEKFAGVNLKTVVFLECGANDADNYLLGSGTLVDADGRILTNAHVLGLNPHMSRCLVLIPDDKTIYYADVREVWDDLDLAAIEIIGIWASKTVSRFQDGQVTFNHVSNICKAEDMDYGDEIWIVGYPAVGGFTLNVTDGIISGVAGGYIKTSAKIEQGNSGGAAFHESGCWIGIPTFAKVGDIESIGYILSPALMEDPFI